MKYVVHCNKSNAPAALRLYAQLVEAFSSGWWFSLVAKHVMPLYLYYTYKSCPAVWGLSWQPGIREQKTLVQIKRYNLRGILYETSPRAKRHKLSLLFTSLTILWTSTKIVLQISQMNSLFFTWFFVIYAGIRKRKCVFLLNELISILTSFTTQLKTVDWLQTK